MAGYFLIFPFAFQMVLILVTGYALTSSRPVSAALKKLAALPKTPPQAVALTVLVGLTTVTLNWGFGLIASAVFAREIAKRHRLDFAWLLAGAYSGFVMFPPGLSSSIALAQATPGSPLNIVQKLTGQLIPLSHSLLVPFNYVPSIILFIVLPWLFSRMQPPDAEMQPADQARLETEDAVVARPVSIGFGGMLDRAWILTTLFWWQPRCGYLGMQMAAGKFHLDINSLILIFLALGLLLHWTPIAYVEAINNAARVTGSLLLQYPIYGGIMGIMTATGLAGVIAEWFLAPFRQPAPCRSGAIFPPSSSAFSCPAAAAIGRCRGRSSCRRRSPCTSILAAAAQGVGYGEGVANMIQPFWALPLLAIAGIGMRRVMGFTIITFFVSLVIFGASMLFLV